MINTEGVDVNAASNTAENAAAPAGPTVAEVPMVPGSRFSDLAGKNIVPIAIFGGFIGIIILVCLMQTIRKLMR